MRIRGAFLIALCGLAMSWISSPGTLSAVEPAGTPRQKKVLIIGIDGTRPDAVAKAHTPHLDELIRNGAFTDTARILGDRYQGNDTSSGPGWSSILTGVWADKHGVQNNSFTGKQYEQFPHFFKRLKSTRPESYTASLVSWEPIDQHIVSEADVRHVEQLPAGPSSTLDLNVSAGKLKINTRDGQWHHLLAVRKQGKVQLFLDGQLAGTTNDTAGEFSLGGEFLHLGRDTRSDATRFNGQLDDIRLWKRALDSGEIEAVARNTLPGDGPTPAVKSEGLLAQYTFETSDGKTISETRRATGTFEDTASNGAGPFHAAALETEIKADNTTPPTKTGTPNQVLYLPKNADVKQDVKVAFKDPLRAMTEGDFTVEARFQTTDSGRNILLGNYDSRVGALNLELHTDNRIRVYIQPAGAQKAAPLAREQERDRTMAKKAAQVLATQDPTALFVYFHQVDATGHTIGFSPEVPEYVQAIANVDECVGEVLSALQSRKTYIQEDWLIIVCTDHGGIKRTHGGGHKIPEILTVFLIVSGPAAQVGRIEQQAYLVDVAATALAHLQGPLNSKWQLDGRPVGLKKAPD